MTKKLPTLVLDDENVRLDAFKKHFGKDATTVYVKCAQDAKEAIEQTFKFGTMYLDHDLGPTIGNGGDVVKLICALPDDRLPDRVYVHSMNSIAGKQMACDLDDRGIRCYYAPFHTLGLNEKDPF